MNNSKVFWGVLFITSGVLILLSNFAVLPNGFFESFWKFWPLFLVLIGLSIIFNKRGLIGAWIFIMLSIAFLLFAGVYSYYYPKVTNYNLSKYVFSEEINEVEELDLDIDFGAGDLTITSSDQKLFLGQAETMSPTTLKRIDDNNKSRISIKQDPISGWFFTNPKHYAKANKSEFAVAKNIPLLLNIDTGASKFVLDLDQTMLKKLDLKFGASDGEIRIGEQVIKTDINIETGASSLKLYLPQKSGIKIISNSGASSNNFSEVGLIKNDKIWKSQNYDEAKNLIDINLSMGASSIDLELY